MPETDEPSEGKEGKKKKKERIEEERKKDGEAETCVGESRVAAQRSESGGESARLFVGLFVCF